MFVIVIDPYLSPLTHYFVSHHHCPTRGTIERSPHPRRAAQRVPTQTQELGCPDRRTARLSRRREPLPLARGRVRDAHGEHPAHHPDMRDEHEVFEVVFNTPLAFRALSCESAPIAPPSTRRPVAPAQQITSYRQTENSRFEPAKLGRTSCTLGAAAEPEQTLNVSTWVWVLCFPGGVERSFMPLTPLTRRGDARRPEHPETGAVALFRRVVTSWV